MVVVTDIGGVVVGGGEVEGVKYRDVRKMLVNRTAMIQLK
jgi:hypothetical protein